MALPTVIVTGRQKLQKKKISESEVDSLKFIKGPKYAKNALVIAIIGLLRCLKLHLYIIKYIIIIKYVYKVE